MKGASSSQGDPADGTTDATGSVAPQSRPALNAAVLAGAVLERDIRRALQGPNVAPTFANAVVHKPPRRDEWFPTLARMELSLAS
jgi:hypothetical protein